MRNSNDSPKGSHEIFEFDSSTTESIDIVNIEQESLNNSTMQVRKHCDSTKEFGCLSLESDLPVLSNSLCNNSNVFPDHSQSSLNYTNSPNTIEKSNIHVSNYQKDKRDDHIFKQPDIIPRKVDDHIFKRPLAPPRKVNDHAFSRPMIPPRQINKRVPNPIKKLPPRFNAAPTLMFVDPHASLEEDIGHEEDMFENEFSVVNDFSSETLIKQPPLDLSSLPKSKNYRRGELPSKPFNTQDNVNNEHTNDKTQLVNTTSNINHNEISQDISNTEIIPHTPDVTASDKSLQYASQIEFFQIAPVNEIPQNITNTEVAIETSSITINDDSTQDSIDVNGSSINNNEISQDVISTGAISHTSSSTTSNEISQDTVVLETISYTPTATNNDDISNKITKKDTTMEDILQPTNETIMKKDVDTSNTTPTAGSKDTVNTITKLTTNVNSSSNNELLIEAQAVHVGEPKAEEESEHVENIELSINEAILIDKAVMNEVRSNEEPMKENQTTDDNTSSSIKQEMPVKMKNRGRPRKAASVVEAKELPPRPRKAPKRYREEGEYVTDNTQIGTLEVSEASEPDTMPAKQKYRKTASVPSVVTDPAIEPAKPARALRGRKRSTKSTQKVEVPTEHSALGEGNSSIQTQQYHANDNSNELFELGASNEIGNSSDIQHSSHQTADDSNGPFKPSPRSKRKVTNPVNYSDISPVTDNGESSKPMGRPKRKVATFVNYSENSLIANSGESSKPVGRPKRKVANSVNYSDTSPIANNDGSFEPINSPKENVINAVDYPDISPIADNDQSSVPTGRPKRKVSNAAKHSDVSSTIDDEVSKPTGRPKRKTANVVNYSLSNNMGESSDSNTLGKRKTATMVNYSDAPLADEVADDGDNTPTNKRSKSNRGKARQVQSKAKDVAEEVNETEIGGTSSTYRNNRSIKGKSPAQKIDRNSLEYLLTNRESHLVDEETKENMTYWISTLTKEDKQNLVKYLPDVDCNIQGGVRKWDETGKFLSHPYYWQDLSLWQDLLSLGAFEKEEKVVTHNNTDVRRTKEESENLDGETDIETDAEETDVEMDETNDENRTFKDENYEAYWGAEWPKMYGSDP